MRRRLLAEFGAGGLWDLKHARGGLVDIEFIAQGLQILHAAENPAISTNTLGACAARPRRSSHPSRSAALNRRASSTPLTQLLRLCVSGRFDPASAPEGLRRLIAQAAEVRDFPTAEATVMAAQARIAGIFDRLIGSV